MGESSLALDVDVSVESESLLSLTSEPSGESGTAGLATCFPHLLHKIGDEVLTFKLDLEKPVFPMSNPRRDVGTCT